MKKVFTFKAALLILVSGILISLIAIYFKLENIYLVSKSINFKMKQIIDAYPFLEQDLQDILKK